MALILEGLVPMWVLGDVDIRLGQEPRQAPSLCKEKDGGLPRKSFRGLRSVWLILYAELIGADAKAGHAHIARETGAPGMPPVAGTR